MTRSTPFLIRWLSPSISAGLCVLALAFTGSWMLHWVGGLGPGLALLAAGAATAPLAVWWGLCVVVLRAEVRFPAPGSPSALVFLAAAAGAFAAAAASLSHPAFPPRSALSPAHAKTLLAAGLLPALLLVGHLALWLRSEKDRRQDAEDRERESRWMRLRAQISPHLLYNSLNGLAELARRGSREVESGLLALARFHRELTHLEGESLVTLGRERAFVEAYLQIETLVHGHRLTSNWHWDERLDGVMVPPLILQPLVENAVKHGISQSSSGGEVQVHGRWTEGVVELEVRNPGPLPDDAWKPGIGLKNTLARVGMVFGESLQFRLHRDDRYTSAILSFRMDSADTDGLRRHEGRP